MSQTREARFAGSWYPGSGKALADALGGFLGEQVERQKALGVVSPHAGYMFSGAVAGAVYARSQVTDTVVILAPNHTGWGAPLALWDAGSWRTPLGEVFIDEDFASRLLSTSRDVQADTSAHANEHSGELQVPFLQFVNPGVKIVPLVLSVAKFEVLEALGHVLAEVIQTSGQSVLVVASSDMTHFESDTSARQKDNLAIAQILNLDAQGLWQVVRENRISMCGIAPATAMLVCAQSLGAKQAELVKYQTSADVTGDHASVVGYAGLIVT